MAISRILYFWIFDAADDVEIAALVQDADVARVHPARFIDRGFGGLRIVPITAHHQISADANLTGRPGRRDAARARMDDLRFDVRHHRPDRAHAALEVVVGPRHERDGRGLGHPIGDAHLARAHLADDALHD